MCVTKFIKEDETLKRFDFMTVFQVLFYLKEKGWLKKGILDG